MLKRDAIKKIGAELEVDEANARAYYELFKRYRWGLDRGIKTIKQRLETKAKQAEETKK